MTHSHDRYDSHCQRTGCGCDHNNCYRGWVDNDRGTWPCIYCNDNLTGRLMRVAKAREAGYPQEATSRIMAKASR